MKLTGWIAALALLVSPVAAQATTYIQLLIDDPAHILDGATVETSITGLLTWESPAAFTGGYEAYQYAGVGGDWVTTISGAIGAGALWNGSYTYKQTGGPSQPGMYWNGGTIFSPQRIGTTGAGSVAEWTNGFRSFNFSVTSYGNAAPPPDGTEVNLTGAVFSAYLLASQGTGGAASFSDPAGATLTAGTLSAVPLPGAFGLLLLAGGGLGIVRRRRG
ncbi:hypothetical protein [Pacificoceanicola onchidii]|uniref:hypothetical protein n=1 Tax=Pacificoceanicola onchidii TaxID=2562685 RepID=UPI0010A4AEF9|nr:hypothetical protein [Pacificoceanicola onchidii]